MVVNDPSYRLYKIKIFGIEMEGGSKATDPMFMKKDIFIKTRKEDIRLFYEFNPKVPRI